MSTHRRVLRLFALLGALSLASPVLALQQRAVPEPDAAEPSPTTAPAASIPPAGTTAPSSGPLPAAPAVAPPPDDTSAMGELMGIVFPLALIIVGLLTVLYLVRRRFGLTGKDAPLTILQILPVGPRERVVLVRSRGGKLFTVGVAAQSVTLVTHLDPADLLDSTVEPQLDDRLEPDRRQSPVMRQ